MLHVAHEGLDRFSPTTGSEGLSIDLYQMTPEATAIAKGHLGSPSSLFGIDAFGDQLFSPQFDVQLELVIRIGLGGAPSQREPEKTLHQALAAARIFPTTATYLRHSASSA